MDFITNLSLTSQIGLAAGTIALHLAGKFFVRSGVFYFPKPEVLDAPSRRFAYKIHHGPYEQSGEKFDACAALILEAGSDGTKNEMMGIYFDNPYDCPVDALRYAIGCDLERGRDKKLESLLLKNGYKIANFPACKCAFTTFPFHSMLSIMLAARRVYTKLYKFAREEYGKDANFICYEAYPNGFQQYYIPIDKSLKNFDVFFLGQEQDMAKYAAEAKAKKGQ